MDNTAKLALRIGIVASLLKSLLIPSYRSTDFEVHRNWLAITHSLPVGRWYYENTSHWTLDYPPLFGWFEWSLSQVAVIVDPKMVAVDNLEYASQETVIFQRLTVIVTDFLLLYATYDYCKWRVKSHTSAVGDLRAVFILMTLIMFNFGLLVVDHIHFQYNGVLFGLLLLSISKMAQGKFIQAALFFTILLNCKHLFVYLAPAYFVYMLRRYCFGKLHYTSIINMVLDLRFGNLIRLVITVVSVTAISFGPFVYMGQTGQLVSRLLPFKRGLCHAYWAPNFWALYNFMDKMLATTGLRLGLLSVDDKSRSALMTGGLVAQYDHTVLPTIYPAVTFGVTTASMLPSLLHLWRFPYSWRAFLRALILCGLSSFLFGWHVHEKHIITVIVPLTILAVEDKEDARLFFLLSCVGFVSLFPLLYESRETPTKILLFLLYTIGSGYGLELLSVSGSVLLDQLRPLKIRFYEKLYLLGLFVVQIYILCIHNLVGLSDKLPFLPLLMTSVYCSIGVLYIWFNFLIHSLYLRQDYIQRTDAKCRW